jgi:hypothetical protein
MYSRYYVARNMVVIYHCIPDIVTKSRCKVQMDLVSDLSDQIQNSSLKSILSSQEYLDYL